MSKFDLSKVLKSFNKNKFAILIAGAVIIILGTMLTVNFKPGFSFLAGMSKNEIATKSIDYINKNLLSGGQTATLVGSSEEAGVVKITIKVGETQFNSYATKDGKLLFPQAFSMNETANNAVASDNSNSRPSQPAADQIKQACDSTQKSADPVLEAYVVSQCPFGLQMQRVLADIIANAPDLDQNIFVRYIGSISNGKITSMHGDEEAQENLREICVRDEQRSKYWKYVSCHIKAGDVDSCLVSAGIDANKLDACMSDNKRGLAYAKEDFDLNAKYGIQGSPTLVMNGKEISEFSFGGRTSEAVKTMICCAYDKQPGVCSTQLNTANAATSYSEAYASSGSSANSASDCGGQ